VGEKDKAIEIAKTVGDREITMGNYLMQEGRGISDLRKSIFILNALQRTLYQNGEADLAKKYEDASESLMASLQIRGDLPRGDR
jgi:hypothetical protein